MLLPGLMELKDRFDTGLRTLIWAAIAVVAAAVAIGLVSAAAFIWIDARLGPIWACLVLGGAFLVIVLIAAIAINAIRRRQARLVAERKQTAAALWRDPAVLALGLRIGRALGLRQKTIPLVVLGAFLIGLVLSGSGSRGGKASKLEGQD